MSQQTIYFWRTNERPYGVFSQWASTPFTVESITYPTAEHWMMYQKAILFNDNATGRAILSETRPIKVKSLGKQVKNFDEKIWAAKREEIVYEGNLYKFGGDETLRNLLVETGDRELVEASPYDRIWGVGFVAKEAAGNRDKWGLNLLGKALIRVREDLR